MQRPTICTIISKNYLAHARCLTESFLLQHPDGQVFVLLADRVDGYYDPSLEQFTTIEACNLNIPQFEHMAFRYTVVEFNTAVKPFLLEYLFEKYELEQLFYFDPDIYFYQPITQLQETLATHSVVLTPHLLDILDDDKLPDEPYILRAGVYNLGFIGLSRNPELPKLLKWWQQKLVKDCVIDAQRGLFVDQRWIDLVPGMFSNVAITRRYGYNVAYWNLKHRRISQYQQQWLVNGEPLVFYHFSGLPMDDIIAISRHQTRYTLHDLPDIKPLFQHYFGQLLAHGYEAVRRLPYAYSTFSNGIPIPDPARYLWRNIDDGVRWTRPFQIEGSNSFFAWLNQDAFPSAKPMPLISNLALEIYRQRWDLQQSFPDIHDTHRTAFAEWFVLSAELQHGLDPVFVRLTQASLNNAHPPINGATEAQVVVSSDLSLQQPRAGAQLYYALRGALRSAGLHETIKRIIGPGAVQAIYVILVQDRRSVLPEAPLVGRPTLKRRLYYAVRNPLRRFGLHQPLKRLIGQRLVETVQMRMVQGPAWHPAMMTRISAATPPETFYRTAESFNPPDNDMTAGLNVIGYVRAETGVGEISRSVLRSLDSVGYPVAYTDLSNPEWARVDDASTLHLPSGHPYTCNLFCVNADMMPAVADQLGADFFANSYNIGYWHWETANFPEQWHDRFAYLDEIWVDSSFVQKTLAAVSPIPVVNVQIPINALQPSGLSRADLGLPEDRNLLLFSFDMRSYIERKNPHGLIEAYRRAFGPAFGRTTLVIKASNLDLFPEEAAKLRSDMDSVSGILLDCYMDRRHLTGLFENCDMYVSLHRSEGFGLTMAEAMALGKPVIATAYSGNMEFMTPSNSYLVGYTLTEIDRDYGPYRRGDQWASPDLDHAVELMRSVVENPIIARKRGAQAEADIRRFNSSTVVAKRMITRLAQIRQRQEALYV